MSSSWAAGWANGDIVTAGEFKKGIGSIYDSTLSGTAASFDVTGIAAVYAHLKVIIYARGDAATSAVTTGMRFNGDTGSNYDTQLLSGAAAAAAASETFAATSLSVGVCPAASAGSNLFGCTEITIPNYAGASNNKQFTSIDSRKIGTSTGNMVVVVFGGGWRSSAAINRITLFPSSGNFAAGTRVTVYAAGA